MCGLANKTTLSLWGIRYEIQSLAVQGNSLEGEQIFSANNVVFVAKAARLLFSLFLFLLCKNVSHVCSSMLVLFFSTNSPRKGTGVAH